MFVCDDVVLGDIGVINMVLWVIGGGVFYGVNFDNVFDI